MDDVFDVVAKRLDKNVDLLRLMAVTDDNKVHEFESLCISTADALRPYPVLFCAIRQLPPQPWNVDAFLAKKPNPFILIVGPRRSGCTVMARHLVSRIRALHADPLRVRLRTAYGGYQPSHDQPWLDLDCIISPQMVTRSEAEQGRCCQVLDTADLWPDDQNFRELVAHRHSPLIVAVQSITCVPPLMRGNADVVLAYQPKHQSASACRALYQKVFSQVSSRANFDSICSKLPDAGFPFLVSVAVRPEEDMDADERVLRTVFHYCAPDPSMDSQ